MGAGDTMARVLIAAVPFFGHVRPMRLIAADLVARGHAVTFLTGAAFRAAVEGTGARFVPLPAEADVRPDRFPDRRRIPTGPARLEYDNQHLFVAPMAAQHAALQALLAEDAAPAVLLHDTMFLGAWPVRHGAAGVRPAAVVGIGVMPLPMNSADHPPFGSGLVPDDSEEGRARSRVLTEKAEAAERAGSHRLLTRAFERLGAAEPPPLLSQGLVGVPDLFLQLSIESLEYPRGDAPSHLRYIGALPPERGEARALPVWWDDVTRANRVILVSQGTIANDDLGRLIEPTLRALADLDAVIVVATGRDAVPATLPANARVAEFIPFDTVLPHVDVLVSNGGYGGVQQALRHGVPLVLAGDTEDKIEVCAKVSWAGAAVSLGTGDPDEADIRKAVDSVLDDPLCRDRARELRAEYEAHDPRVAIADAVDGLAVRRG
ncbi:MGT family glycosyltransferase [Actinoalloteichus hoggarensis]|uniref:4'-demethylrebeccamycin synthase n=1 Tax=Actinoalloteichus hoggarensis TaxID=1470176 RepID=A0A221W338_9PSEU|nr:glycosyltransferase [Actinoalloteichus hoggarensis]ASO20119.1 4'-demethylrebeccamycin synthase [Actinoalloteichus hoggarensis]MBB5919169.1 MGT family glycosyltransferase [Actinoalloteichus hoggarensis]